jgi:hypothetical protein
MDSGFEDVDKMIWFGAWLSVKGPSRDEGKAGQPTTSTAKQANFSGMREACGDWGGVYYRRRRTQISYQSLSTAKSICQWSGKAQEDSYAGCPSQIS